MFFRLEILRLTLIRNYDKLATFFPDEIVYCCPFPVIRIYAVTDRQPSYTPPTRLYVSEGCGKFSLNASSNVL